MKNKSISKIKNKNKKNKTYFFASFFITLALSAFISGLIAVDINSKNIGWSDKKTEFAFSVSNSTLNMTVLGKNINISSDPISQAKIYLKQIDRGIDCIKPSPAALWDKLYYRYKPILANYIKKLYEYAGNL